MTGSTWAQIPGYDTPVHQYSALLNMDTMTISVPSSQVVKGLFFILYTPTVGRKSEHLVHPLLLQERKTSKSVGTQCAITHWWLGRVTFVVDWQFLPQNFGPWWGPTKAFCSCVNADGVGIVLAGGGHT